MQETKFQEILDNLDFFIKSFILFVYFESYLLALHEISWKTSAKKIFSVDASGSSNATNRTDEKMRQIRSVVRITKTCKKTA